MFGHNDTNPKKDNQNGSANDGIAAAADAIANDRSLQGGDVSGGTLGSYMPSGTGVISPATDTSAPAAATDAPAAVSYPAPASTGNPDTDGLLDIKHEALQALTPLVGQLNQTPEEQFRTTMMMIQASDNHNLLKVAYEAAKNISNEKERAQALLDIVNEINYFTQQQ